MPKHSEIEIQEVPKSRHRGWCFTINNYTEEEVYMLEVFSKKCVYMIYGLEVGEEDETPHVQGYAYYKYARYFSCLKKAFPRAHIEIARGSAEQNHEYCSKEGRFVEFGAMPKQGGRTDIADYVKAVQESSHRLDEEDLLLRFGNMTCKYPAFVDRVQRHFHPPKRLTELNNLYCFGEAGTGKSEYACNLGDFYIKAPNKWFCGYQGQENVIIDDLEPKHATALSWFIKIWADYRPFTAQVKGSSIYIRPKRVIITSNYAMEDLGLDKATLKAFKRRFEVKHFIGQYDWAANQAV